MLQADPMHWFVLSCIGALVAQAATLPFLTVWRTTAANENITLPFSVPVNNLNISWGDGQSEIVSGTAPATHSYSVAGLYNMSIAGDITGFRFNSQGHASKLMEIVSWGDGFIMDSTSTNVFAGCVNLQVSAFASTQPVFVPGATLEGMFMNTKFNSALNWNLTNVTSVAAMFTSAKSLNQSILFSNALGVTSTAGMFQDAIAFNHLVIMQTDNVNTMQSMFEGASSFNQIVNFNTGKVQYMNDMFYGASAFNQPINFNGSSLLQVDGMFSNAANFNQPVTLQTDNVNNMQSMFQGASSFNQPVNFNTGKVQYMNSMFSGATAFNQPINFNGSSLLQVDSMFANAAAFNSPVNLTNTLALTSTSRLFYSCSVFNQTITFQTDNVTNMDSMFQQASVFNQPVNFNTGKVQSMQRMFASAYAFNRPINFDTSSLNIAEFMFQWASAFNSPVNFTNTSTMTSPYGMFQGASLFNQPVAFQTGNVVSMGNMFNGASSFNQPVPFNTRKVQVLQNMFANAFAFNQPINFDATSLTDTSWMFNGASAFNNTVNLTNISSLASIAAMFLSASSFNQPLSFQTDTVTNMNYMFSGATKFNQPVPFNTRKVQSMSQMFMGASAFNQPINFDATSLTLADSMFAGASVFNSTVNLTNISALTNVATMFVGVLGFKQDLRGWNVSSVTACSNFCFWCGLPSFQQCVPCPTGQILTSVSGMSVCNCPSNEVNISSTQCGLASPAPTTAAPTTASPTTAAPTTASGAPTTAPTVAPSHIPTAGGASICKMVQVRSNLQVECIGEDSSAPSPSPPSPQSYLTGIISPLFNITRSSDDNNTSGDNTSFVFTLPIDPQLYTSVGTITRPCESQQLSCEWQDPQTLEFLRSGCVVSKDRVDMGSGVIGTECTCTHLTVFAIALRSELQLAPLCQAQEVDYVLMALYAILGVGLVTQVTRIVRYQPVTRGRCCVKTDVSPTSRAAVAGAAVAAVQVSLIQHSLLLLVCVLRIVYLAAKPVIGSLAGLVALGLLPSAFALSLFIHLLLTWAGLQLATFEASPFARFRVPFVITTLLVFGVVIVLAAMTGVTPEVAVVRDGSYVLAALYAVVCVLVLLSGLGMRKSIPVVDAVRSMDWRVVFRCRLLVVTLGLSTSLFLAACLWVAAVQTDIVTSSAATLTTTASFYVFDWLSLCVLTWLFSFAVKEATDNRQRGATKDSSRETSGRSNSNSSSRRDNSNSNNSRRNSKKDNYTKPHAVELDA